MFFPTFQVSSVTVQGTSTILQKELEDFAINTVRRTFIAGIASSSIFLTGSEKIAHTLKKEYPGIESVEVKKKLPNALELQVVQRKAFAALCKSTTKCSLVDRSGFMFETVQANDVPEDLIILGGKAEAPIDTKIMDAVALVTSALSDGFQIKVKKVSLGNPLVFTTNEGWQLYVDPKTDVKMQMTKLSALLTKELPKEQRRKIHYIYLQYKDKAYFK